MKAYCASLTIVGAAILLACATQAPQTGPATGKRFPPLKLPSGFKATLFACDPLIEYPSVIAAGPKPGALYVAIDYMTGLGSDGKVKSEIKLVEDTDGDGHADKATVVAKGLNSIQGLAHHDGTLYVMHAPYLTTIRKGERKDLLSGLGLKPEDNPPRLHCANGVVLGHDGWLYLALGDNGVNVPRPEGDRLILNGGGILRCRPDGRDLHVFSTGLRNIYDIALDAELNVFTRDNENDGGTYMIRVCHSFFGADHGYPYDYEERPDHALKPIGDFGLGSSAGGVCYIETQFPPEYRGNLFFCEWGKSVVRYPLQAKGSGFAPVKEIEFATGDPKDPYPFKPTDIVVQQDGTLMVSDYADGQRPKRGRGRIYHIAFQSKNASKENKLEESYVARCMAQQSLERQGKQAIFALEKAPIGPRFRAHVVWAWADLEGAKAIERLIGVARSDPDASVRRQAVRALADLGDPILVEHKLAAGRGDAKLAERIAALDDGKDAGLRLEVVIALGRLKWAGAPTWIQENLQRPDATLMHAAMQTLRHADNWPAVLKLLDGATGSALHTIALRAVSDRFEHDVVDGLLARLKMETESNRRRELAELLTRVYKKPGPWKYWGYRPGPRPANTEAWERTDAIGTALDAYLANAENEKRLTILKHMQREKMPVRAATLGKWLASERDGDTVAAILTALKEHPPAEVRDRLKAVLANREHRADNRIASLTMMLKEKDVDVLAILTEQAKTLEDGTVLAHVLRRLALQAYQDDKTAGVIEPKLKSADGAVRAAAMWGLGHMSNTRLLPYLAAFLEDKDVRVRRAAASAAHIERDDKNVRKLLIKAASDPDVELRRASLISLRALHDPNAAALAAASLAEPTLTADALSVLRNMGDYTHADVLIDFAKRDVRSDTLANAIMGLTEWSKPNAAAPSRDKIDRGIAEIHGTHGVLVRWRGVGPMPAEERAKAIDLFKNPGNAPEHPLKKEHPFFRIGRVELARNDDPKKPVWLAYTDVAVPAATNVEFFGAAGGSFEVFLNGKSIHQRAKPAKFQPSFDRFSATMEKGLNRVLVQTGESFVVEFDLSFRRKSSKAEHEALTQAALARTGNAERGRKLFLDKDKSRCIQCHQLAGQGERIGPELTGVGDRFSRIHLIESILEPSRTIAPSFGAWVITLKNGKTLSGVKVAENEATLTIADNQGQKHTVASKDIDEIAPSPISIMPDGLVERWTQDEFVDLIAFLVSQKSKLTP